MAFSFHSAPGASADKSTVCLMREVISFHTTTAVADFLSWVSVVSGAAHDIIIDIALRAP
jgi:hypothetical protein